MAAQTSDDELDPAIRVSAVHLRLALAPDHDRRRHLRPGVGIAEAKGLLLGAQDAGLDPKAIYNRALEQLKMRYPDIEVPSLEELLTG